MNNGINRKDELFNALLDDCLARGIGWTNDNITEGNYTLQVSKLLLLPTCEFRFYKHL